MRLEPQEITDLANALAPLVADIILRQLNDLPELAKSIPEAAAFCQVEEYQIRDAIAAGRLPHIKIGRSVRIRRSDLFAVRPAAVEGER